jgi:glyoxylase-like metal-dependent hydrolase (beta-lactamase superfamily II)
MTETSHTFGPYSVTLLQDGVFEPPNDILIHAGGAEALAAAKAGLGETLHLQVNAFLVQGPGGVTLVDAGIGQAWGPGFGHARGLLAAAGIAPAAIDRVLLTHLHADHAMGLLDGDQAWLENAEIMVPALDMDYFSDDAVRASLPEAKHNAFDMTKTLLTAYAGRLRRIGPGPVPGMPGVELVALPGHTPGHSGYRFHGDGDLLLWADTLHVRDAQAADPDLGMVFDVDPEMARQTRIATLAAAAHEGWTVAGAHVAGFGKIVRAGGAYAFTEV